MEREKGVLRESRRDRDFQEQTGVRHGFERGVTSLILAYLPLCPCVRLVAYGCMCV